ENNDEHSIKCGLARKRPFMPDTNHGQGGNENDDAAERDLNKGQVFRLHPQTQKWSNEVIKAFHSAKASRRSHSLGVSGGRADGRFNSKVGKIAYRLLPSRSGSIP